MIHIYGHGQPRHLFDLLDHHASGVGHLVAPLAVALMDILGRDDRHHEVHFGRGWNSVSIYPEGKQPIALRARQTKGVYDRICVHRGSIRPLGPVEMEIRGPLDIARFQRNLKRWIGTTGL
jgi:hypothetical protein